MGDALIQRFSTLEKDFSAMTQHNSFKADGTASRKRRNVLKRFERVALLKKKGLWKEGNRVTGLAKTKAEE